MKLYQYALIYHPRTKKDEVKESQLIDVNGFFIVSVLAKDEKQALLKAARSIPKEFESKLDQVEIAMRPF